MIRWSGSEEQVTSILAIVMILAALLVVGSYALEIAHHTTPTVTPARAR